MELGMKEKPKALIVDDEASSRSEIRHLLIQDGRIDPWAEADTISKASSLLKSQKIDVVFLDIKMPGLTGLEFASLLKRMINPPVIVFITAFGEHALEAFELAAVDYLLKPVSEERLRETIDRILKQTPAFAAEEKSKAKPSPSLERIFVEKEGGKKIPIPPDEIYFFEARDDYSMLYTKDQRYLITNTLKELELKLTKYNFLRVHRKYLVNLNKIGEVIPISRGTILLRMTDLIKSEILVSRRKTKSLKQALGL